MEYLTEKDKEYLHRVFTRPREPYPEPTFANLEKAVNRVIRDVTLLNNLEKQHKAEVAEIETKRKVFAAQVVDREVQEARENHAARVRKLADELLRSARFVHDNAWEVTANKPFDVTNPEFQNILAVIKASGPHLPVKTQLDFIKKHQDNRTALGILRGVYKNNGYTSQFVEEEFQKAESTVNLAPVENIARAAAHADYEGHWTAPHPSDVQAVYNFGVKYGMNLTENPLVTDLKAMATRHDGVSGIVDKAVKEIEDLNDMDPEAAKKIYQEALYKVMTGAQG